MSIGNPVLQNILDELRERRPDLEACVPAVTEAFEALAATYDNGGKLLLCGNGGSHADALHIAGELCKSFERKRPLPPKFMHKLVKQPGGEALAAHLERGLPAITLGLNGALKTAVENDSPLRNLAFAQETYALIKPEDTLLAISTSGNARNCLFAMSVANAMEATTVALTGSHGGAMAPAAAIAIKAPGDSVKTIQEAHIALYHTLSALIEAHYFPHRR